MVPHIIIGAVLSVAGFIILQFNKAKAQKWREENPEYVNRVKFELGSNFNVRPLHSGMTDQIAASMLLVGVLYFIIAVVLHILK
nr:hypothetical protein [uncultured Arsenicibacter sp.]